MRILLICTGNTCRSSMAEVLLKQIIESDDTSVNIEVGSAGLATIDGLPAADQAIKAIQERGLDLNSHTSQVINPRLLEADLILTMTRKHKEDLLRHNRSLKGKIFTLKEYAGEKNELDIKDPFGGSLEVYRSTAQEIQKYLELAWKEFSKRI